MLSDGLNLANLPSDIIHNIIEMEILSINSMVLISPWWNCVVSESLARIDRRGLPKIDSFRLRASPIGISSLRVLTDRKYGKYFGLTTWDCFSSEEARCGIFMREFKNMDRIIRMLNRCSCITTFDLHIDKFNRKEILKFLSDELVNVNINGWKFTGMEHFTKETCKEILNLIKKNTVHSIEIKADRNTTENLTTFLSEAAKFVPKIVLSFYDYAKTSHLFWQNLINSLNNEPVCNHTATWEFDSFRIYITVARSEK